VVEFKIPHLLSLLPQGKVLASALEIGCATGELIGNVPVVVGGRRTGCDISPANIAAAAARFTDVDFFAGDFNDMHTAEYEAVILSDILEHVEDDVSFLRLASKLGRCTLINLPLEDNWLNNRRAYGPEDSSGHLRRYNLKQGLDLIGRAGLNVIQYRQVWFHETAADHKRRDLRRQYLSHGYSGTAPARILKQVILETARVIKPFGRRLLASNLFAVGVRD
jgi:hypothetical protein